MAVLAMSTRVLACIQESHRAVVRVNIDLLIPDNMPLSQTVSNTEDKSIATQTVRHRLGASSS